MRKLVIEWILKAQNRWQNEIDRGHYMNTYFNNTDEELLCILTNEYEYKGNRQILNKNYALYREMGII